ncbi:hypothetical protein [Halorubrum coriense]|uniref:hypothetical protein n=1 Tax=Halorubrum coriense TaxID=64713 RepID=UPI000A7ED147|nr:hypothetical protein [Halorubrum coriense]
MTETFHLKCPGCGTEKAPFTTHDGTIGVHCSCGVSFNVDIEARQVGEWWVR